MILKSDYIWIMYTDVLIGVYIDVLFGRFIDVLIGVCLNDFKCIHACNELHIFEYIYWYNTRNKVILHCN